jgi:ABC-2 type transport system ATP-binding protein
MFMANAIEIRGLTKTLNRFCLGPIDLTLPEGCVLGLIGENGAGKSTLISLLLGLKQPDGGSFSLLGETPDHDHRAAQLRQQIGVVLDIPGFPDPLNRWEIGRMLAPAFPDWDEELYERYCADFKLPEETKFSDYSRGMKMKLSIAAALAHHPRLLLLDEPTGGLDPVMRDEILDIFYDFMADPTHSILISSHILTDLEKICDYIAFLHEGKLLLQGEKDELKERYALVKGTPEQISALPASAVLARRRTGSVDEALIRTGQAAGLPAEPVSLEDIMVYLLRYAV